MDKAVAWRSSLATILRIKRIDRQGSRRRSSQYLEKTFEQLRTYQRGLHFDVFALSEIDARELKHVSVAGFAPDWRVDRLMSDATFLRMVVRLCEPFANLLTEGMPQLALATPKQVWKLQRIDRARLAALVPDLGAGAALLRLLDAIVIGTAIESWPELTRDVLLDYGELAAAVSERECGSGKGKSQQAYERFEHDCEVIAHTTFGSGFSKKLLLASDDRVVRLRDYLKARPSAADRPPALPHELNAALVAQTFADWPDVKRDVSQLLTTTTSRAGLTLTRKGDTLREDLDRHLDALDKHLADAASIMTRPAVEQEQWCGSVADAIDDIEAALHKLSLRHGIGHVNTFLRA